MNTTHVKNLNCIVQFAEMKVLQELVVKSQIINLQWVDAFNQTSQSLGPSCGGLAPSTALNESCSDRGHMHRARGHFVSVVPILANHEPS